MPPPIQSFRDVMIQIGAEVGEDLTPDRDGLVSVVVDDIAVSVESPNGSSFVYFHACVRRISADRAGELDCAMRANLFDLPLSGAWLALDGATDELVLCSSAQMLQTTALSMTATIEALAASVRDLRARPAASATSSGPASVDEELIIRA